MASKDSLDVPRGIRSTVARRWWPTAGAIAIAVCLFTAGAASAAPGDEPPAVTASFNFAPSSPLTRQTVTFTSTSAATGTGNAIAEHRWDLDGSGSFETGRGTRTTASRSYSQPGPVTVSLQVTDTSGNVAVASHVLTVGNRPPTASFTYTPTAPAVYDPVTFASTASDPEGRIADLSWDLNGDGDYDNGRGASVLRTFERAGSYVVGLKVTDAAGGVDFVSRTVTVAAGASGTAGPGQQGLQAKGLGLRLINPFPVVRIAGRITARGTRVRLLRVDAPIGSKVSIRCRGRSCPFASQVWAAAHPPEARSARRVRVRRLERLLRAGVVVKVFVTRPGTIGKYTQFRIRRAEAPARVDKCLNPGSLAPVRCPTG